MMSHVTHNREARGIKASLSDRGVYTFKTKQKLGKEYIEDGRPLGESYVPINDKEEYLYRRVPGTEPVLPGYYSWWGVSLCKWEAQEVKEAVFNLKQQGTEVANYLKVPPESTYGNNEFVVTLSDIIQYYSYSRRNRGHGNIDIYLKVGGTLRYKREICYVIIVCTKMDEDLLSQFPYMKSDQQAPIDLCGLVDPSGKVINPMAVPIFRPQNVVNYYIGNSFSWEGVAFAFYFPQKDKALLCPKDSSTSERKIEHSFCTIKYPLDKYTWRCPNEIWM